MAESRKGMNANTKLAVRVFLVTCLYPIALRHLTAAGLFECH